MKSKVDKLDVVKLLPVLVNLSKLSDIVKNDVVKKTEYDELANNVNTIQTTDTSDLVKKTDYNKKINEIEKKVTDHDHSNKYTTTQEFNKITAESFASRLAKANLVSKNDIAALVKKTDFDDRNLNKKVTSNETKPVEA